MAKIVQSGWPTMALLPRDSGPPDKHPEPTLQLAVLESCASHGDEEDSRLGTRKRTPPLLVVCVQNVHGGRVEYHFTRFAKLHIAQRHHLCSSGDCLTVAWDVLC